MFINRKIQPILNRRPPFNSPHGGKLAFSKIISESKHLHGADDSIIDNANNLRRNLTPAELKLWKRLRGRKISGFYFRRQHPYGIYIIDFFCSKANLAIEVDGEIHDFKKEYDTERTRYLEASGIKVIRFTNAEVLENIEEVLRKIKSELKT